MTKPRPETLEAERHKLYVTEAPLEFIKDAATHSDIGMTQRYSRNAEERIAVVQLARLERRGKPKNET